MPVKRRSWVQPSDVAEYFHVTASTVRRWISDGRLRAARLPTGHLRILARDVIRGLLAEGKEIPPELGNLGNKHVLILDPDKQEAGVMAAALSGESGCKVTVASDAVEARSLLENWEPNLVVLGIRQARGAICGNGNNTVDVIVLAAAADQAPGTQGDGAKVVFRVSDILSAPVDQRALVSRVAHILLG